MKIGFTPFKLNFNGYDALPLKNIYLERSYCEPFIDEMKDIAKTEGFGIKTAYDHDKWIQDDKTIIEKDGKPYLIANGDVSNNFFSELNQQGIKGEKSYDFLTGGDTFIGKFPNGEKWMLSGELIKAGCNKKSISDAYEIKEENIFSIPKQNYHLDTFIRPINYPFVLVNDFNLVDKNIHKISQNSEKFSEFIQEYNSFKRSLNKHYCGANIICKALEGIGFVPIRIAGVYGPKVNFLNAIVNKHKNGTISYITNSSKDENFEFYTKMQEMFEKDLRDKIPDISRVYFVEGKNSDYQGHCGNYMMSTLYWQGGGIHCMSLEEPNFKAWG